MNIRKSALSLFPMTRTLMALIAMALIAMASLAILSCGGGTLISTSQTITGTHYENTNRTVSGTVDRAQDGRASGAVSETCQADRINTITTTEIWRRPDYGEPLLYTAGSLAGILLGGLWWANSFEDEDDPEDEDGLGGMIGGFLVVAASTALFTYSIIYLSSAPESNSVDYGDSWEQPIGRVPIDCIETDVSPLSGQVAELLSSDGRLLADLQLDTSSRFEFSVESLSSEDVGGNPDYRIFIPSYGVSGPVTVSDPTGLQETWNRTRLDLPPPRLSSSAILNDRGGDGDGVLEPDEVAGIEVMITNDGPGDAFGVVVSLDPDTLPRDLTATEQILVGDLSPGERRTEEIPIHLARSAQGGALEVLVQVRESRDYDAPPLLIEIPSGRFEPSALEITDFGASELLGNSDGLIEPNEVIALRLTVLNDGEGGADGLVRVDSVSAGAIQGEVERSRTIASGNEAVFEYQFLLPRRESEGVGTIEVNFSYLDRRMGDQHSHRASFEMGAMGDRPPGSSDVQDVPAQRVFLMEQSEATSTHVGGSISALHEALTREGWITIATTGEEQVALTECMDTVIVNPNERRTCELEWANRLLYDWAILIDVERDTSGDVLVIDVFDPHTAELVWSDGCELEGVGMRACLEELGSNFQRWLRRRLR